MIGQYIDALEKTRAESTVPTLIISLVLLAIGIIVGIKRGWR